MFFIMARLMRLIILLIIGSFRWSGCCAVFWLTYNCLVIIPFNDTLAIHDCN